jgi:predicted secreted protein
MQLVTRIGGSWAATLPLIAVLAAVAIALGVKALGITVAGGIALYFVVWWTMLFAVLPFGARTQSEEGAVVSGSDPGAPSAPRMAEKAIWTTLVADVVFLGALAIMPLAGL